MKKNRNVLSELEAGLPKPPKDGKMAAQRRKPRVVSYNGVGLKTYTDALGNEIPLPLSDSIICRAPALLREVTELWRGKGANIMAQQFIAAHAVIGAVLDGCYVRQQENTYMLNLQVMIVGGAGAGKSRVALLDRLVEPIDHELRLAYRRRLDSYRRELQQHALTLAAWKQNGGKGECPLPPEEPLPRSLMLADATTQAALVRWLAGNDGHPSLMRHDELSTLKNALDDRCGAFGDILKKAFDNGKHEKQLRTADEGYYIRRVGLATVFSTTPGVLKQFIGSYEDGMGSRIIGHFTASEPRFDADMSDEEMQRFNAKMAGLAERVEELWRAASPQSSPEGKGASPHPLPEGKGAASGGNQVTPPSGGGGGGCFGGVGGGCLGEAGRGYFLALSPDQQERFVRHFRYLLNYYVALDDLGEEAVPIIRRRAVDARRILMIWSVCRRAEEIYRDRAGMICFPADGLIRPTDEDVKGVLMFADYLVCQSVFMHRLVMGTAEEPKSEEKTTRRTPLEHLKMLGDVFTREEADSVGRLCGVSPQTTKSRIVRWIGMGYVREVGEGAYEKLRIKN